MTSEHEPDSSIDTRMLMQAIDAGALPLSDDHPCVYLANRTARIEGLMSAKMSGGMYGALLERGFRRSGALFYRPVCASCRECIPVRVPVAGFRPTRSQRRVQKRNADVTTSVRPATPPVDPAVVAVYREYLDAQHPGSPQSTELGELEEFLYSPVVPCWEIRYEVNGVIVGVSIVDYDLDPTRGYLSSVYHFFAPQHASRSVGTFSILAEIERCRSLSVPYYYLGYWIRDARTMAYKSRFGPQEHLVANDWELGPF